VSLYIATLTIKAPAANEEELNREIMALNSVVISYTGMGETIWNLEELTLDD